VQNGYPEEKKARCLLRRKNETQQQIANAEGISLTTLRAWERELRRKPPDAVGATEKPLPTAPKKEVTQQKTKANILIYDIETLPNLGYFWDTISDRAIPLDFIVKPKSICSIAWKWYGEANTQVFVIDEPYNDKRILEQFLPEWQKADYAVAHYSRFDKPFIAARLMANSLPSLPPVNDICTYKLAKAHFGRTLNGNKLDHLGTILGVGNKIKTNADLWVKCASGDKQALADMAAYNAQDVELLSHVFTAMLPHVKSKLNLNLMTDEPLLRCKQCGSDNLMHNGYEYASSTMRHRYSCKDCGSWSTFSKGAI
jgi:DNA-binding XRE family transcriptional regulator